VTMIMYRSFAETMGLPAWPPDVAERISTHRDHLGRQFVRDVTWAEVHEERRQRQRERLAEIRRPSRPEVVPAYVWVFEVPGWIYGGWWCYVVTHRTRHREDMLAVDFRTFRADLALSIMRTAPCGFLPAIEFWEDWKPAFAREHQRSSRVDDPRPSGSLVGWLVGERRFVRDCRSPCFPCLRGEEGKK